MMNRLRKDLEKISETTKQEEKEKNWLEDINEPELESEFLKYGKGAENIYKAAIEHLQSLTPKTKIDYDIIAYKKCIASSLAQEEYIALLEDIKTKIQDEDGIIKTHAFSVYHSLYADRSLDKILPLPIDAANGLKEIYIRLDAYFSKYVKNAKDLIMPHVLFLLEDFCHTEQIPKDNEIEKISLFNTNTRKDLNDSVFKYVFTQIKKENEILGVKTIYEGTSKKGKAYSKLQLAWEGGIEEYLEKELKFNALEREIFKTAVSEHLTHTGGNRTKHYNTTPEAIYRAMVGDDGERETRKNASQEMIKDITDFIEKASLHYVNIDLSDICKKYGYNNGEPCILKGNLLYAKLLDNVIVNGKHTTIICFSDYSPFVDCAELKNGQFLTYDKRLLNIPKIPNTKIIIAVKGYLWQRVLEITQHGQTPEILIQTVLEMNDLEGLTRQEKNRLIKDIEGMLEYWLKEKEFAGFALLDRKGNILRGKEYKIVKEKVEIVDLPKKAANLGIYKIKIKRKKSQNENAKNYKKSKKNNKKVT